MSGFVFPSDFVEYVESQTGGEWSEDLAQAVVQGLSATRGGLSVCARIFLPSLLEFIETGKCVRDTMPEAPTVPLAVPSDFAPVYSPDVVGEDPGGLSRVCSKECNHDRF